MVHVSLIIFRLVALVAFSFLLASQATAVTPINTVWSGEGRVGLYFASAAATCDDQLAFRTALETNGSSWELHSINFVNPNFAYCNANKRWGDGSLSVGTGSWSMSASAGFLCPPNSTESGGACTCNSGYMDQGDTCEPEPTCAPGQELVGGVCEYPDCPEGETRIDGVCSPTGCPVAGTPAGGFNVSGDSTAYTCMMVNFRACSIRINPTVCVRYEKDGILFSECYGEGSFTGGSCWGGTGAGPTPGPGSDPDPDPDPDPGPGPNPTPNPGGPGAPDQGNDTPRPAPGFPAPNPVPPEPDGECPAGTTEINGACIQNPVQSDPAGNCPSGSVKVGEQCIFPSPPGEPGGSTGGGGTGEGDGDCEPGSTMLKCSTMGGLPGGDGINRSTRNLTFAPDGAMATSGSCPANVTIPLLGTTLTVVDMAEACDLITTYVRPIAILLSAFMALGIAAGVLKTDT